MTAYYNDIEDFPCRVLEARIADGRLPAGLVDQRDITTIHATDLVQYRQWHLFAGIGGMPLGLRLAGVPDDFPILTGGFPCQDISCAGKGEGIDGERSGLFWRMLDVIRVLRPRWLLLENVAALRSRGFDRVADALEAEGYAVRAAVVGAWAVGAPHKRDRVWIVAHASRADEREQWPERLRIGFRGESMGDAERDGGRVGQPRERSQGRITSGRPGESSSPVADAGSERRQERQRHGGGEAGGKPPSATSTFEGDPCRWPARPGEPQHEWEAPRLVEFHVGQPVDGLSERLAEHIGRITGWDTARVAQWWQKNKVKIDRARNRKNLRGLGNAVVPQVVAAIARNFLR